MIFFDVLAILTLLYWTVMLIDSFIGLRRIHEVNLAENLPKDSPRGQVNPQSLSLPFVSVIFAARNEEKDIQETVRQLLAQDYPCFEVIVVNDRSTDRTSQRLHEVKDWWEQKVASFETESSSHPRPVLKTLHITELPEGWLGKNHALYQGTLAAEGDYYLFTDADVRFHPLALRSAVSKMLEENVDFLTLSPLMIAKKLILRLFVHYFLFSFTLFKRLWTANQDKQHKSGIGIGAFNLIKREVYEALGTHRSIAMRPDDDLQLGMRVKQLGYRQRLHTAKEILQVEWYPTLPEAIRGLEKNTFAGLHYSFFFAFFALFGQLFVFLFPFLAVFLWQGWKGAAYAISLLFMFILYILHIRKMTRSSGADFFLLPLSIVLFCYVFVRAIVLTLFKGGIVWRGTFYPLSELRKRERNLRRK